MAKLLVLKVRKKVTEEEIKKYLKYTKYSIFLFKRDDLKQIYTGDKKIYEIILFVFQKDKIKYEESGHYIFDVYSNEKKYMYDFFVELINKEHLIEIHDEDHV